MVDKMRFEHPEEELKYLEQKVAEKKKELAESMESFTPKEAIKAAVQEHTAAVQPGSSEVNTTDNDDPLAGLDHKDIISGLVSIAMSEGIEQAVSEVRKLKNPHLLDEFHDALTDRLYERMKNSGVF